MVDVLRNQDTKDIVSSHSMTLFRQGIEYMKSDKFSEALLCFEQVYKTGGHVPNLHYACAVAFIESGQIREAILACQSEIARTPDHRDTIALLNKISSQFGPIWPENTYIVNHEHRFVYCPIPRVMCSNTKMAMVKIADLHEKHGHDEKDWSCKVHGNTNNCVRIECTFKTNITGVQQILNDDRYFKFVIVRNPWSRLVSGYLSKIVNAYSSCKSYNKLIRQIEAENDLSPDTDNSITFRQFAEHEVRKSDMKMNDHWRPQVCFTAGHKFDFIAKFENIQNDLNYINNKLGLNLDISANKNTAGYRKNNDHQDKYFADCYADELLVRNDNSGGHPDYKQFYPSELKKLVAGRYACDIKAFGYEF